MDVHPTQHVAKSQHLDVGHHRVVANAFGLLLIAPYGKGMRGSGGDRKTVSRRMVGEDCSREPDLCTGLGHCRAGLRRDFYLRLQQLGRDAILQIDFACPEELPRHGAANVSGLSVDNKIFLFNPQPVMKHCD